LEDVIAVLLLLPRILSGQESQSPPEKLIKRGCIEAGAKPAVEALVAVGECGAGEGGLEEDVGDLQVFEQQDGVIDGRF
jgi:hypothetical protein